MSFILSQKSLSKLEGVHPDLVKVVKLAIQRTPIDFMVIEGIRTSARQQELYAKGASKTLNSRHLTGHAVDLAPLTNGTIDWNNTANFRTVADVMFQCASELGVELRWGGDWNGNGSSKDEKFYDGPHFELPSKHYPA